MKGAIAKAEEIAAERNGFLPSNLTALTQKSMKQQQVKKF